MCGYNLGPDITEHLLGAQPSQGQLRSERKDPINEEFGRVIGYQVLEKPERWYGNLKALLECLKCSHSGLALRDLVG